MIFIVVRSGWYLAQASPIAYFHTIVCNSSGNSVKRGNVVGAMLSIGDGAMVL